jgi:hypothetical protein
MLFEKSWSRGVEVCLLYSSLGVWEREGVELW